MPTNYTGRIILTLAVLLAALWAIFPSGNLSRPDLKPGIDMVGGTSLLYEIQQPPTGASVDNLAEEVASALKKRVDPEGVRNLIWRPQGNTRLEIQMPLTRDAGLVAQRRQAYNDAQQALERTNVRPARVMSIVRNGELSLDERREQLTGLAGGSADRQQLFVEILETWDQIQRAEQQQDAETQATLETRLETVLVPRINELNLPAAQLESILSMQQADVRAQRLADLREQHAGWDARLEAIEQFRTAYADFAAVRGALDDASDLKRLLQGSGVLEFYILAVPPSFAGSPQDTNISDAEWQRMVERLRTEGPQVRAGDQTRWIAVDRPDEIGPLAVRPFPESETAYALAWITPEKSMTNQPGGSRQWALEDAYPTPGNLGETVVGFSFDPAGAALFSRLTGRNIGERLAIALDERIISAPVINDQIGRSGTINGGSDGFTNAELTYLINTLDAGSLPAQLADEPIMERTVGPQLGEDNLRAGLIACFFGVGVVALFLIGYYYIAGAVAMVAVLMNLVIILGVMAMFNATFTLPAIAGIVLTIGMAVDANVLIFERLREEQQRGLSLRMALRNAYDRAWSAILDGNVTTGITSFFLYFMGSEEVRGFGLTLLIGILSSLFTSLYVTRTIFGLLIDKFEMKRLGSFPLSFPRWDRALKPNIDWMSKAWAFITFSAVFIVIGLVAFGIRWAQGRVLDIEFASGTSVQFELVEPMPIAEVRRLIDAQSARNPDALPSPSVVSVGTGDTVYEIVTPQEQSEPVKNAVVAALGDRLKIEVPSEFDGADQPLDAVEGRLVVPVRSATQEIAGFTPVELGEYVGGAAIVLQDLSPPLPPAEIEQRIERQRLLPQPGQATPPYRPFTVVSPTGGPDAPTDTAVVLVSDPAFPFERDEAKWRSELARPMWTMVAEAVSSEAQLQKVTNFDAQVAAETQREALIALVCSMFGIMAYIWIRFGNLKYGTATVIALVHDTLFVIAALGIAHYLWEWGVGAPLLLEPFRINLTVVAAVLTVMGWSMNDTVVIFDRIRENRGKYGLVSRRVINDSINQTLSRTLLTGGTTFLTLLLMYIIGGAGIHGFTFIMVVGILAGTYSSIAIASPILLFGQRETQESEASKATPAGQLQRA